MNSQQPIALMELPEATGASVANGDDNKGVTSGAAVAADDMYLADVRRRAREDRELYEKGRLAFVSFVRGYAKPTPVTLCQSRVRLWV